MISKLRSTRIGASPIDGSSMSMSFGRAISARPIATICCSPPDSVPASWVAPLVQQREERVDALVVLRPPTAVQVRAHLEVLEHRHRAEEAPVLRDDRHPLPDAVARRARGHVLAVERHRAGPWPHDPEDRLQRRRLPGRVPSEQAHELARADLQVRVLEDVHLAVVRVDRVEPQQRARAVRRLAHFRSVADAPR